MGSLIFIVIIILVLTTLYEYFIVRGEIRTRRKDEDKYSFKKMNERINKNE